MRQAVRSLFFGLLLLATAAEAQPGRELLGRVVHLGPNDEEVPDVGVIVTFVQTGDSVDTNDQGYFRLPLRPAFGPGKAITLSVDKRGWLIRFPIDGELTVPDSLTEIVRVELLPKGSKLLWSHERIEKFIQDLAERSKQEGRQEGEATARREVDFGRYIKEWAVELGFTPEQAREEVDRWIADVEANHDDLYKLGLASFAKKEFGKAAEQFQDSAEARLRQLADTEKQQAELKEKASRLKREIVRDLRLAGDSLLNAYRFQEALAAYQEAMKHTSEQEDPQLWAAIVMDSGIAQAQLGMRVSADRAMEYLNSSASSFRRAQQFLCSEVLSEDCARTQNNLGTVLQEQGVRQSGEEGLRLLGESEQAYRQALEVYTRESLPQDWAAIQNNLGNVLQEQGVRQSGEEGLRLLSESEQAYRQALEVRTRESLPQGWAMTQNNLGNVLQGQGIRQPGEEGLRLLGESEQAYRQALEVRTRESLPQDWAKTQHNLGAVLQERGIRQSGEEGLRLLGESVQAYRQALEVYTRESLPQDWAMTQNNLGNVLADQGARQSGKEGLRLLGESEQAYRQALEVLTRGSLPQHWATTQNNLGTVLHEQGARQSGEEGLHLLGESVQAYQHALEVRTREHFPEKWRVTRANQATAMIKLGDNRGAAQALTEIIELDPGDRSASLTLATLLHDKLHEFSRALEAIQAWLVRHPEDPRARLQEVEALYTNRRIRECRERASASSVHPSFRESHKAVLAGYEIASLWAEAEDTGAAARLEDLIARIAGQPAEFRVGWPFPGTKSFLAANPDIPRQSLALQLFEALESPDRDTLLQELKALQP